MQAQGMSYANVLGLDVASPAHDSLHLEDFKFTDLKWAKSSRMSKRWLVFFVRIKVSSFPCAVISCDICLQKGTSLTGCDHRREGARSRREWISVF